MRKCEEIRIFGFEGKDNGNEFILLKLPLMMIISGMKPESLNLKSPSLKNFMPGTANRFSLLLLCQEL